MLKLFSTSTVFAFPRWDCGIWRWIGWPACSSISFSSSTESELHEDPALSINLLLFNGNPLVVVSGRYQSMKPMIGKSIDQSMIIDDLLVNWHRLASANRWPIDNHTKVVATHRLSLIGVEKISVSHTFQSVRIRTRSTHKCLTFEFVHRIVCMLLHGFKNQQQKHALKQCFEEWQVNNTPFRLAVPFAILYTVDIWLIWIFRNFIFPLFPIFPTGPVHTPCKMKLLLSDLSE